ncbi:hypothetical protein K438DRAFT_1787675 [Mycena galopus ATCC 62051]|nr:hypothetical protein K438DRAFT_1787675 [Mycena galopus ATCC 62051]
MMGVIELCGKKKLKPRLRKEVKPITRISQHIYEVYGAHTWGFVIDPQGEASFAFGVGDAYKEMRKILHHQLAMQVKDQEHAFYGIELRKRGEEARALPLKRLNAGDQEPG